jgi:hypothetical protein
MGSTRTCKRCGKVYYLIVPYSKARRDIREYCPECHPAIIAERQAVVR